jgi:hypothetical protein
VRQQERIAVVASTAIVATCAVYLLQPSAPIYYPLDHAWRWEPSRGVSMVWYGRSLWALAAGLIVGFITSGLLRRRDKRAEAPSKLASVASLSALGALVVTLGYTVLHEWSKWVK